MTNDASRTYTVKALTDLWTGDAEGKAGRRITTGLLGSIRWWFEVLVRGLGGKACDPTRDGNRCPDSRKKPTDPGHRCVVCELFGCTGWARKFRFDVLGENDRPKQTRIENGETFKLRFTELRPIDPAEWALLELSLRLIAEYGAIGGRTTLKNADYGLIKIEAANSSPNIENPMIELRQYVKTRRAIEHSDFEWASLEHFWTVRGRNLYWKQFQQVFGGDAWLSGKTGESKKIFTFKNPEEARRTFGFVKPGTVDPDEIRQRLKKAWPGIQDTEFLEGQRILTDLLGGDRGGQP